MSYTFKTVVGIALALIFSGRIHAQEALVTQRILSLSVAKTIAEAALAECKSKGAHPTVAVVDRAGQLLVLLRDEKSTPETIEMARRKAYTARIFRITTLEFRERTKNDQPGAGQRDVTDMLALGGGVPIKAGNETIGDIGSSGSSQEIDDGCAKAGVAKVANLLK
jgi:uncharacterized protein GlcG (DUF336 family)